MLLREAKITKAAFTSKAVRTSAIQLQYKFFTMLQAACKFSASCIAALYCRGPHNCCTTPIQENNSCIVVVLHLCGPLKTRLRYELVRVYYVLYKDRNTSEKLKWHITKPHSTANKASHRKTFTRFLKHRQIKSLFCTKS